MIKIWTPEETEYLEKWYPVKGRNECAKDLHRTIKSVSVKASKLGLKVLNPNNNKWTEEELSILKEFYPTLGGRACEKLLTNRSYKIIVNKASSLGIKAKSLELTHDEYEQRLMEKECEAYPLDIYINMRTPINHSCIEGHTWKVTPHQILSTMSGCPFCANYSFDTTKPAILYYIRLCNGVDTYYKIGITNRTVRQRMSHDWSKVSKVLLEKYYNTGTEAYLEEQKILNNFPRSYCDFIASGNTEVFEFDVLNLDK